MSYKIYVVHHDVSKVDLAKYRNRGEFTLVHAQENTLNLNNYNSMGKEYAEYGFMFNLYRNYLKGYPLPDHVGFMHYDMGTVSNGVFLLDYIDVAGLKPNTVMYLIPILWEGIKACSLYLDRDNLAVLWQEGLLNLHKKYCPEYKPYGLDLDNPQGKLLMPMCTAFVCSKYIFAQLMQFLESSLAEVQVGINSVRMTAQLLERLTAIFFAKLPSNVVLFEVSHSWATTKGQLTT